MQNENIPDQGEKLSICKGCGAEFTGEGYDCGVCNFIDTNNTILYGGHSTEFLNENL